MFLYNTSGSAIAYRRTNDDRYLWDTTGQWIGWFPWNDADAVAKDGSYLGTVVGDRLLRRTYQPYRGYPGHPGHPGHASHPGYGGHAGYSGYLSGFGQVPADLLIG